MKRRKLSKTKQLRRDLHASCSALAAQTAKNTIAEERAVATIQRLEQQLKSLCGARFTYDHNRKAFHACIYLDRRCLEDGASTAIHSAVMQLVELIYREDFRDRTLNIKRLLEEVSQLADQEFDAQLYPHLRQIVRDHPKGEPPISSYRYFSLAKRFLKVFIQMAAKNPLPTVKS